MFYRSPRSNLARTAFGNESMDMRIPLEISTESMKNTDETGSEIFCFIHFCEHAQDYVTNGMKETVKQSTILTEVDTKFFWNCKDTVPMNAGDQLRGHVQGT